MVEGVTAVKGSCYYFITSYRKSRLSLSAVLTTKGIVCLRDTGAYYFKGSVIRVRVVKNGLSGRSA